jgi:hypothetical protein
MAATKDTIPFADWQNALASREACRHPGKFQGCAPYVAFYWDAYLDGGADRDDGDTLGFNVTAADRVLFPELRGRRAVRLRETSDGFVVEG